MGGTNSTQATQDNSRQVVADYNPENAELDKDTSEIISSLNITELHAKEPIPLIGGSNLQQVPITPRTAKRNRYSKYDIMKMIRDLDSEYQAGGGNSSDTDKSEDSDVKATKHIKNIILEEINKLKQTDQAQLTGGGCGCNGNDKYLRKKNTKKNNGLKVDQTEGKARRFKMNGGGDDDEESSSSSSSSFDEEESGRRKRKTKKSSKRRNYNSDNESSEFFIETSQSGGEEEEEEVEEETSEKVSNNERRRRRNKKNEEDEEEEEEDTNETEENNEEETDTEEGLSIFPFNSSDVKSSVSIKNYKMLRRKI
jgi:hypothetical protein